MRNLGYWLESAGNISNVSGMEYRQRIDSPAQPERSASIWTGQIELGRVPEQQQTCSQTRPQQQPAGRPPLFDIPQVLRPGWEGGIPSLHFFCSSQKTQDVSFSRLLPCLCRIPSYTCHLLHFRFFLPPALGIPSQPFLASALRLDGRFCSLPFRASASLFARSRGHLIAFAMYRKQFKYFGRVVDRWGTAFNLRPGFHSMSGQRWFTVTAHTHTLHLVKAFFIFIGLIIGNFLYKKLTSVPGFDQVKFTSDGLGFIGLLLGNV